MIILGRLQNLRHYTSGLAFSSPLYNWSLRGDTPERLIVRPVDPWTGDATAGAHLFDGVFNRDGDGVTLSSNSWEPEGLDTTWLTHIHGFTWLRDLRAYSHSGGKTNHRNTCQNFAQQMITAWIDRYRTWQAFPWRADIMGERLSMWIALHDFFGDASTNALNNDDFHDLFFDSLMRQTRHLSRVLNTGNTINDLCEIDGGLALSKAAKGLLYAGLSLEGHESWIEQALDILIAAIDAQILEDGAHISRNAATLLSTLQILLDIRQALRSAGYPLPEKIQHAIDKMGPALRFFRYNDKKFALFNGTQEKNAALIDAVLGQIGSIKNATLQSLPCAGYERASMGRTLLMFDAGGPPPTPYDGLAHAAPLSFEMNHGKERLFVNCGTHPFDATWRDAMRGTAGHNALTIDHRNAYEINEKSSHFGRKSKITRATREESKQGCLLESSHDGYAALNSTTHRRRLYLSANGHNLRGEDRLTITSAPASPLEIAVRFHLHPRAKVSLTQGGQEALIRLPDGSGWRFCHSGGILALEDSLYLGQGTAPRKTKQIVIHANATTCDALLKWSMSKEG